MGQRRRGAAATPLKRSRTSAAPVGFRASEPLKMTSSIFSPRRLFALCSPMTHVEGVGDVALAAAVRADNRGHAAVERQLRSDRRRT